MSDGLNKEGQDRRSIRTGDGIPDGSMTTDSVSVIVPCYNEAKHISAFLESLHCQSLNGLRWEVLIADGMSQDGTREVIEGYRKILPALRLIDNPSRFVSSGLNTAIRQAKGDIIIRMDVHTEYAPDYISQCLHELERTSADNVGGPARTRANGYLSRAIAAAYHSPFACGGARFHDESFEGYVDTVPYGCWHKTTLEDLGLFDETLVRNQDDELNLRITRSGGRIWQSPAIVSWYSPRASLSSLFRQYFQYGFWKVAVIRKHRIPASWRHMVPVAFVLAHLIFLSLILTAYGRFDSLFHWSLPAWLCLSSLYAVSALAAAYVAGLRHGWQICVALPLVFAAYHVSYGLGFLFGLFYWPVARFNAFRLSRPFTEISR